MNELKRTISSVVYQLHANAWVNSLLLGVSCGIFARAADASTLVMSVIALVGFGVGAWINRLYEPKKMQAIHLLHQAVGDTEYSLDLFDKPVLNIAEQLQIDRLNERIQGVRVPVVAFTNIGLYISVLAVALGFAYTYPMLQPDSPEHHKAARYIAAVTGDKIIAPEFESAELIIQPPAYTRLPVTETTDLNAVAVSGSTLRWTVSLSDQQNVSVRLVNSRGNELAFTREKVGFVHTDKLMSSGLYAIKAYWKLGSKDSLIYQSDFYRLEAKPDMAPKIQPDSKELYQFHYLKDPKKLTVSAKISDDFSVSQAFIVATVARGAGENVKFREVKIPLGQSNFKESHLSKVIDLKGLNFAPGDELYYYWAAFDNKQPEPNFSKSDTYFLVYKDTTRVEESELAMMAVNIMPEYFRSQRQIIIDTEKLLAKRKKLDKKAFNSQSNEIGYDQKLLRLRYGQYLGEEFETNIGAGGGIPDDAEGGNVLDGFMHKHDSGEGEHETHGKEHEEHEHEHEHGHDHGHGAATENSDPLAALMEQYVHSHDDGEANTFYEQSTRSLLKMALEQMWQSELHLRMYEPEKAIPFEQKALEYLKAAQQKARTFVKKSGYDPPPIKEKEMRLTGELKNVNTTPSQERSFGQQRIEQLVSAVLGYLDLPALSAGQRGTVQQLGSALSLQVVNSGLSNWSVLTSLQKLASGKGLSDTEKAQLQTKLYKLTGASVQTTTSYTSERRLQQAFRKRLR
nr:DUF4175 family protein [uncultured Arsenicibacter sp.]